MLKEKAGRLPIKRAEARSVGTGDLSQVWIRERFTEGNCGGFEATAHRRAYDEGLNGPRRKLFPQRSGIRSTSRSKASFTLAFTALIPDEWFAAKALHMPCQDDDVGVHLDASPKPFVGTSLPSKAEKNKRPKRAHLRSLRSNMKRCHVPWQKKAFSNAMTYGLQGVTQG